MSKHRLLLLTPDFPPSRGGIQTMSHRLATHINGFNTQVLTLDEPGARSFDAAGVLNVRRVHARGSSPTVRNAQLNARTLGAALSFRPHVTLSLHLVLSPAAAAIRLALGSASVQIFHAQEIGGKPRLAAFAVNRADAVIVVSSYTAELLADAGGRPSAMHLISGGVDLPRHVPGVRTERPTVVTVARLRDRYKGHDVLARALALVRARVPEVEWIVIGDGPLRGELEALARSSGLDGSVRFLGAVSDEERDRWLARADVMAMPSRLPGGGLAGEGFGLVYLEAGAFGTPVVAGRAGGALDAVIDGETGLLVDPTDPRAVAEAITRVLLDEPLARRLGSAGAERARRYAWPARAELIEGVLLEALSSRAAT